MPVEMGSRLQPSKVSDLGHIRSSFLRICKRPCNASRLMPQRVRVSRPGDSGKMAKRFWIEGVGITEFMDQLSRFFGTDVPFRLRIAAA